MNNFFTKYKDLALKVIYYTKKRTLGEKVFFATSKFQDVLTYFEKKLKDSQTFLKSSYLLNGKQIYPSDILLYFCTLDPNLQLVEEDMFLEIDELEKLDDSSDPIYEKLLTPIINPFKIMILNVKDSIVQQAIFPKEKIKELGLDTLNNNYACCNSTDSFYLSCGKNFWIISNSNYEIEKKEMPFFKEKHSMTYILSNNTIFIAGGSEESFYYDINSKEFITWGKMNGIQEKPALIEFEDHLYSINSFNENGIFFEKTKLKNPAKIWEKIVPQSADQESSFFYNKLFGVSKCSGGNIIFAGGINNQLRTFMYNVKLNLININPCKDESILLKERNFYKIDHNFNIAIPQNIEKDHIIAILNKNSKTLNLRVFEETGFNERKNILKTDIIGNRIPGNILIQCKYMSKLDYENYMKQKNNPQKNVTNNNSTNKRFGLYSRREDGQKLDKYRGKTPALERITEGKSDEESDEEDTIKNRPSSAKKEKSTMDLGLNLDNFDKFKFSSKKKENKIIENNNDEKKITNIKVQKEENENIDNDNNNIIKNNNINNNNNNKNENEMNFEIESNENEIKKYEENKNKEKLNKIIEDSEKKINENKINKNDIFVVKKEENSEKKEKQNKELKEEQNKEPKIEQKKELKIELKKELKEDQNKEPKIEQKEELKEELKEEQKEEQNEIKEKVKEKPKDEQNVENKKEKKEEVKNIKKIDNSEKKKTKEVKYTKINLNEIQKDEDKKSETKIIQTASSPYTNLYDKYKFPKNNDVINNEKGNNKESNLNNKTTIHKNKRKDININKHNKNNKPSYTRVKLENNSGINNINNKTDINNINPIKGKENQIDDNKNKSINENINIKTKKSNEIKNINMTNYNINNINSQPSQTSQNINSEEQKNLTNIQKAFNIPNLKNSHQNPKDNNNNIIVKSNNYYTKKPTEHNYSLNPFVYNDKYNNLIDYESYNNTEDLEPNANRILTDKNIKSIKEIKKSQKKPNYKTNKLISNHTNSHRKLFQLNPNKYIYQNIFDKNINKHSLPYISYKYSTHRHAKRRQFLTFNHSVNSKSYTSNREFAILNTENTKRNSSSKRLTYIKTEEYNNKYTEIYMKNKKIKNPKLNELNIIKKKNSEDITVRKVKSGFDIIQKNTSKEKNIKENKNNKNTKDGKDGKRYVLYKIVQRVRREDGNNLK